MLTRRDGAGVHAVDGDAVGLPQLLGPHAHQRLVGGLGGGVDGLARDAEAGAGGRDEDDAAALGEVGLDGLCEEDGALDVRLEVAVVEVLGRVDEVGLEALGGAGTVLVAAQKEKGTVTGTGLGDALVDENINLARGANLLRSLNNTGDLVRLAHVGVDHNGLGTVGLDLLRHLFGALAAAGRDVVDDDIGAALAEEDGDAGSDAPVQPGGERCAMQGG